jgi:hypothetical protein
MPSLLDGMNVTLRRAALEARTCSDERSEGRGEGEVGEIPRNVQAAERVQLVVVGVGEREGRASTCAGCQAALTGIIVAL